MKITYNGIQLAITCCSNIKNTRSFASFCSRHENCIGCGLRTDLDFKIVREKGNFEIVGGRYLILKYEDKILY